mgnify:CR=1 FL=1
MELETLALRAGYKPGNGETHTMPIYQSTTYEYTSADHMAHLFDQPTEGHIYSRISNPTVGFVEEKIAAMEGGVGALMTTSGQAASLLSVLNICKAGDHILCTAGVYGGTVNLFGVTLKRFGIDCTFDGGAQRRRARKHAPGLLRDAHQSDARRLRHRKVCRLCAQPRHPAHRGQHVRHAHALPAL